MADEGIANRRFPRVAVQMKAQFSVLVPEETFNPINHDATVCDISERGMMIRVEFTEDLRRQLLHKMRYCRVRLKDVPDLPDKLTGQAVWIDPAPKGEAGMLRVGLYFSDVDEQVIERLRAFVASAQPPENPDTYTR